MLCALTSGVVTCAGANAGVVSHQPLVLDDSDDVDPERSLVFSLSPAASLRLVLSVQTLLQLLSDPLLSILIDPAAGDRRPINTQRSQEEDDVAVFGEFGAKGHWEAETEEESVRWKLALKTGMEQETGSRADICG